MRKSFSDTLNSGKMIIHFCFPILGEFNWGYGQVQWDASADTGKEDEEV